MQRKGDWLRVVVQVADTAAGTLIWSATFDRTLSDIFAVEDEIAEQATGALSAQLGGLEPSPAAQERSSNVEAYLATCGVAPWWAGSRWLIRKPQGLFFEKAIALDPNFTATYASLCDARLLAADFRHEDLAPFRQRFRPLIETALAIDPTLGAAFYSRAMWADASFEARHADFLHGIALDPSNGRGLTAYDSWTMTTSVGRRHLRQV